MCSITVCVKMVPLDTNAVVGVFTGYVHTYTCISAGI